VTVTRNILVIGGSAGATGAIGEVLSRLPPEFPATIFVAMHVSPLNREWLSEKLQRESSLVIESPKAEQRTQIGHVYVARPDHHLIVKENRVLPARGPRENLWRPAIDVLFRTAAVAYGTRVIGLLMSGELDDGTAGLQAIKHCGGLAVTQVDADNPDMPRIALENVSIDFQSPLHELPNLLQRLVTEPAPDPVEIPQALRLEARIAEAPDEISEIMTSQGDAPSAISCPECGGPLWARGHNGTHLRCLVGHSYHLNSLLEGTDDSLDRTLWAAIRQFEQRAHITHMMSVRESEQGRAKRASLYESRAEESRLHARRLRELMRRGWDTQE
jgi:two-component system, chemotaxis family, protein-glutamate methylesterase/glutaminase